MVECTRRRLTIGLLMLANIGLSVRYGHAAQPSTFEEITPEEWAEIQRSAMAVLAKENSANSRPFIAGQSQRGPGYVFIDYFPPMPLSFRNQARPNDTYEDNYLQASGSNGRFRSAGGYIEERPLPTGPWDSPFWREINLAIDILRAREAGADGFMIDVLRLPSDAAWMTVLKLFETAARIAPDFKLVPEIDHAALKCVDTDLLANALLDLEHQASIFRTSDGRILVAAFAPEFCDPQLWKDTLQKLSQNNSRVAFLPIFLSAKSATTFASIAYGLSVWGTRDPASVKRSTAQRMIQTATRNKIWMEPVAPQDIRPKVNAFNESAGADLFRSGWEKVIADRPDFVHVITWNDYSETTEVEPSTNTQYVFYDLLTYYTFWFKFGNEPVVKRDAIYYLHRENLIDVAQIRGGSPFALRGETPLQNIVELLAFLTAPADLEITQGDKRSRTRGNRGLNSFQVPASEGRPTFRIIRNSNKVVELESHWTIGPPTSIPRPIYVGGCSTRDIIN